MKKVPIKIFLLMIPFWCLSSFQMGLAQPLSAWPKDRCGPEESNPHYERCKALSLAMKFGNCLSDRSESSTGVPAANIPKDHSLLGLCLGLVGGLKNQCDKFESVDKESLAQAICHGVKAVIDKKKCLLVPDPNIQFYCQAFEIGIKGQPCLPDERDLTPYLICSSIRDRMGQVGRSDLPNGNWYNFFLQQHRPVHIKEFDQALQILRSYRPRNAPRRANWEENFHAIFQGHWEAAKGLEGKQLFEGLFSVSNGSQFQFSPFFDPIEREPLQTYLELEQVFINGPLFQGMNPPETRIEKIRQELREDLLKTYALFQTLQQFPLSSLRTGLNFEAKLNAFELTLDAVEAKAFVTDYQKELSFLNPGGDPYLEIFLKLNHRDLLAEASYQEPREQLDPQGQCYNADLDLKRSSLIKFFANIRQTNRGSREQRKLSELFTSSTIDHFPAKGKSPFWFAEIRYKLCRIGEKLDNLDQDQKVQLICHGLHGGEHCSDAKLKAVNDYYQKICSEDAARLEEELKKKYPSLDPMKNAFAYYLSLFKRNSLQRIITEYISQSSLPHHRKEAITVEASTWDHFAPLIGLEKKEASYHEPHWVLPLKNQHMEDKKIGLSPHHLFHYLKSHRSGEITKATFGNLSSVIKDEDVDLMLLIYLELYGIIQEKAAP